jgi:hypothetical protein
MLAFWDIAPCSLVEVDLGAVSQKAFILAAMEVSHM